MELTLCPSMMCADMGRLHQEMTDLQSAGVDAFHVDIMDGRFVPNFGMGLQDTQYLCAHACIPVEVHLMIVEPYAYLEMFAAMGVRRLFIHPEAEAHTLRSLEKIRKLDMEAGIAINPATSYETVYELLPFSDHVTVMSVNPGFAGQQYIPQVEGKIRKLVEMAGEYEYDITVDGACSAERIKHLHSLGARGFVLGSSALFGKGRSYCDVISQLRSAM